MAESISLNPIRITKEIFEDISILEKSKKISAFRAGRLRVMFGFSVVTAYISLAFALATLISMTGGVGALYTTMSLLATGVGFISASSFVATPTLIEISILKSRSEAARK